MNSSGNNDKQEPRQSQESSVEPHPKDGHLRMPNYLVERLAKLRLNGTQWQILWAVWRKTLCWQQAGEWGNRPYPISIDDLVDDTGINESQLKREMGRLIEMNVLLRENTLGGRKHKAITSFNLDPSTWEAPRKGSYSATFNERVAKEQPFTPQKGGESATQTEAGAKEKGSESAPPFQANQRPFPSESAPLSKAKLGVLNKHLKKHTKETRGPSPQGLGAQTPASKYLFEKTGRKRWQNLVQKEQFEKAESEVGEDRMKEAIDWALTSGISNIKSIITAARRKKNGRAATEAARRQDFRASGRRDKAPTHEEYIASLPPSQRSGKQ